MVTILCPKCKAKLDIFTERKITWVKCWRCGYRGKVGHKEPFIHKAATPAEI